MVQAVASLEKRVGSLESKDAVHDVELGITRHLLEELGKDVADVRALGIANSGELKYQRQVLESIAAKLGVEVIGFRAPSDDSLIRQLSALQRTVKARATHRRSAKDWAKLAGGAIAAIAALGVAIQQLASALGSP